MDFTLGVHASIQQIDAAAWDALVPDDDPFLEHAFFDALERSRSTGTESSGWLPQIVVAREPSGRLIAALPLFARTDSYGEFIFDWAWADASHRAGLPYYPKLTSSIPFTPVTGKRFLVHPEFAEIHAHLAQVLLGRAKTLCAEKGFSGLHLLFHTKEESALCGMEKMTPRLSFQYHWQKRPHWHDFDAFLADMRSPLRKQIKKERRTAEQSGLALSMRRGTELSEKDWEALYMFYRATIREKGARAYLTREFFELIRETFSHRIMAAMAHENGEPRAAALYFTRGRSLFGRYWGSVVDVPVLHFELCYYQPIAWALAHGIERFEAGAQGDHKLRRGLLPNLCFSSHYLAHEGLSDAVSRFAQQEARQVRESVAALSHHGPFHRPAPLCDTWAHHDHE